MTQMNHPTDQRSRRRTLCVIGACLVGLAAIVALPAIIARGQDAVPSEPVDIRFIPAEPALQDDRFDPTESRRQNSPPETINSVKSPQPDFHDPIADRRFAPSPDEFIPARDVEARRRANALADFDSEQAWFRQQIQRLRLRLERLEARLEQRSKSRESLIKDRPTAVIGDPAVPPISSSSELLFEPSRSDPGPIYDEVISAKKSASDSGDPDTFDQIPPPHEHFNELVEVDVESSNVVNSPGVGSIETLLIGNLNRIHALNAQLDSAESLSDEQRQQLMRLAAQYPIICEQIASQRRICQLQHDGLNQQLARIEQARTTLVDAGIGTGAARNEVEAAAKKVMAERDALMKTLAAMNRKDLMPNGHVLKNKHLKDVAVDSGHEGFDEPVGPPVRGSRAIDRSATEPARGIGSDADAANDGRQPERNRGVTDDPNATN